MKMTTIGKLVEYTCIKDVSEVVHDFLKIAQMCVFNKLNVPLLQIRVSDDVTMGIYA